MCWDGSSFLRNIVHAATSNKKGSVGLDGSSGIDDDSLWCFAFSMMGRLVGYIALLAVVVIVISLVFKWISECGDHDVEDRTIGEAAAEDDDETAHLLPVKTVTYPYGTGSSQENKQHGEDNNDIEAGDCSSPTDESGLYDGKICVICYDEERGCFFVPCGHCATCYDCAIRIFQEDGRMCPVCRRYIGKIRKLS